MAENKEVKMGVGLVVGLILGAIGGVLLAPKSGKESRDAVATKMKEMKDMIESGEMQTGYKKFSVIFQMKV